MAKAKKTNDTGANLGFEAKLWQSAVKLRNNMDAAEYKHVVLGLIFLKYISDAFDEHHQQLEQGTADPDSDWYVKDVKQRYAVLEDRDEYLAVNVFWVPKEARWAYLQGHGERLLSELATVLQRQRVSGAGRRQLYGYLAFYRAYPQIVRSVSAQSRHLVPLAVTDGRLCKRCLHKSLGITIWRCWRNDQTNSGDSGLNRRRKRRSGRIHSLEPGGAWTMAGDDSVLDAQEMRWGLDFRGPQADPTNNIFSPQDQPRGLLRGSVFLGGAQVCGRPASCPLNPRSSVPLLSLTARTPAQDQTMNVVRLQTHRPDCSWPATDAGTLRRDDELTVPFTEARKLGNADRTNLEGFGYGG